MIWNQQRRKCCICLSPEQDIFTQVKAELDRTLPWNIHSYVAQSPSHVQLSTTPWTAAHQVSLSLTVSRSLPRCHPTISSSVALFSFCLQSFPASESFLMSQLFASNDQTIGGSTSASVLLVNIQGWFLWGLTGWISLLLKGLLKVFSNTTILKASTLWCSTFFMVQLLQPYVTTGKTIALTVCSFVDKVDVFAF